MVILTNTQLVNATSRTITLQYSRTAAASTHNKSRKLSLEVAPTTLATSLAELIFGDGY